MLLLATLAAMFQRVFFPLTRSRWRCFTSTRAKTNAPLSICLSWFPPRGDQERYFGRFCLLEEYPLIPVDVPWMLIFSASFSVPKHANKVVLKAVDDVFAKKWGYVRRRAPRVCERNYDRYLQIIRRLKLVQGWLLQQSVGLLTSIIFLADERVIKRGSTTKKGTNRR